MARRRRAAEAPSSASDDSEIVALYGLPPADFTRARNALAARLRKAGHSDAAEEVKALRKPSPPVWAINQVARQDAAAVGAFVEAVRRLRVAQERRQVGAIDDAVRDERAAFERVVGVVRRRLVEAGVRDSPETMGRVAGTLRGAAADPSRQEDLRRGTLTEELRAPGFEVLAAGLPRPESTERIERPARPEKRGESPAERRERERRERAEEALRVASSEVEEWRRRADELAAASRGRREAMDEAKRTVQELRERLAEAQERLEREERAAEQAERAAERARRDAERAEARLRAAEKAQQAARSRR